VPNITDGTYEIISALGPTVALDVKGASDKSGANVQVYTRNGTDAQKFTITNDGDNGTQIACTLSGRCLDLASNQLKNGANVRQWDDNDTHAQRWDIAPDGKNVTIGGKEYPTYVIKSHGTAYAMDVSGGNATPGTNVQIFSANATDAQRWVFLPVTTFNNLGTYVVVCALDENLLLSVPSSSKAIGTDLHVWTFVDNPDQCWQIVRQNDGTLSLVNCNSGQALDDEGAGTKSGTNAQQYPRNNTNAQRVLLAREGSMTIDGQLVPTYVIRVQAGKNLVLDERGMIKKNGTKVFWHDYNGGANQRWAMVPASARINALPTPASLAIDAVAGNNLASTNLYFICNWANFQGRCRFRSRKAGGAFGAWSAWGTLYDALAGNYGWGDAWAPTVTLDETLGDNKKTTLAIRGENVVDGTTITATEIQVEIRSWAGNWGGTEGFFVHGNSTAKTFGLYFKPTPTITKVELCGLGVRVYYTSDYQDGGCTVTVSCDGASATEKGKYGGSGSVLIPCGNFTKIPDGEVTATVQITGDIPSDKISATMTITKADRYTKLSMTGTESRYGTHLISVPINAEEDTLQAFIVNNDKPIATYMREKTETAYTVEAVAPLTDDYDYLVWVQRADGTWDAQDIKLSAIKDHAYCWTFDGGGVVLDLSKGDRYATQEDTISRAVEDYEVVGREYHAYRLHKSKTRTLDVTGAVSPALPEHGAWNDFDALLEAGHAIFRNPRGEIIPVVVTDVSRPFKTPHSTEIKISQKEETR
jgi:hypothetical protein